MTLRPDLFNAILSMDAYNRGYDAALSNLSGAIGSSIGDAEIFDEKGDVSAEAIEFYQDVVGAPSFL